MKNLILVLVLNCVSSQLIAMKKDSLQYRNSLEFSYQRNYSFYKIISYSDAIVNDAAQKLNAKQSNESAIYTNIIGLFYTFRINPWVYIRSGFSTGTIGYVSSPELIPIYQGYKDNMGVVHSYITGYEKVSELFPTTFLNLPIQLGFQKKIKHTHITPYILIGFEGLSIKSPFLKNRSYESFQNSTIYRFRVENDFDLSNAKKEYYTPFNFYSISTGINLDLKKLKLGLYYQFRSGKKHQNNLDHWRNLNILERQFSNAIGITIGCNY